MFGGGEEGACGCEGRGGKGKKARERPPQAGGFLRIQTYRAHGALYGPDPVEDVVPVGEGRDASVRARLLFFLFIYLFFWEVGGGTKMG